MSKPRNPTASGISRLLAAAGFERSESSATRIKGYRRYSEGYSVAKWDDYGSVEVTWHRGLLPSSEATEIRTRTLASYIEAINAAGFSVRLQSDRLIVTTRTEEG